jgi:hypothetical protein
MIWCCPNTKTALSPEGNRAVFEKAKARLFWRKARYQALLMCVCVCVCVCVAKIEPGRSVPAIFAPMGIDIFIFTLHAIPTTHPIRNK